MTLVLGTAAAFVANPTSRAFAGTRTVVKKATATTKATSVSKTITGRVVDTRWGPVQVSIKIAHKHIADIAVPVYPHTKHRSQEINDRALPGYHDEVISAQSAMIDNISGATVTWDGYTASLQQAIDTAHAGGLL